VFLLVVCLLLSLARLWRLCWFHLRPSSSRGKAKRTTLHRLLIPIRVLSDKFEWQVTHEHAAKCYQLERILVLYILGLVLETPGAIIGFLTLYRTNLATDGLQILAVRMTDCLI